MFDNTSNNPKYKVFLCGLPCKKVATCIKSRLLISENRFFFKGCSRVANDPMKMSADTETPLKMRSWVARVASVANLFFSCGCPSPGLNVRHEKKGTFRQKKGPDLRLP